jgi:hypothetical protein
VRTVRYGRSQPLRIALVSPKGPLYRHRGGIFGQKLRYMPLTLPTLAALVPADLDAHVRRYDEGIADIPQDLGADLVGMTVITGSAPRAYELAARFRARGMARCGSPWSGSRTGAGPRRWKPTAMAHGGSWSTGCPVYRCTSPSTSSPP